MSTSSDGERPTTVLPQAGIEQPAVTTAPATRRARVWHRKLPARIGRARTSTVVIGVLFVLLTGMNYVLPQDPYVTVPTQYGEVRVRSSQLTATPTPADTPSETAPPTTGEPVPSSTSAPATTTTRPAPTAGVPPTPTAATTRATAGAGTVPTPTPTRTDDGGGAGRATTAEPTTPAPSTSVAPTPAATTSSAPTS
jgi:hypothetical protein